MVRSARTPPSTGTPLSSRHRGYLRLLSTCLVVMAGFTLPRPLNQLTALGYTAMGLVMLRSFNRPGLRHNQLFLLLGGATLSCALFWYLTPVGLRSTGVPVLVLWALFSLWSATRLIRSLAEEHRVNGAVLRGALAGYLMLGLTGGLICSALETIGPGNFSNINLGRSAIEIQQPVWGLNFVKLNYFAFVTLTTTGYGDVIPQTPAAQMLTMAIAVAGTVYQAVVMGLLISRFTQSRRP